MAQMWGPGPRSRSRLDPTQPGRANLRPASALGAAITLTVAVPIFLPPAIEAADALLLRLASAADVYSDTASDQPCSRVGKVGVELAKVDEALADFTVAVRVDLGFGDVRTQGDPDPER